MFLQFLLENCILVNCPYDTGKARCFCVRDLEKEGARTIFVLIQEQMCWIPVHICISGLNPNHPKFEDLDLHENDWKIHCFIGLTVTFDQS